eukprot:1042257-Pelagomonas_calceolata.AAC.1
MEIDAIRAYNLHQKRLAHCTRRRACYPFDVRAVPGNPLSSTLLAPHPQAVHHTFETSRIRLMSSDQPSSHVLLQLSCPRRQ